MTVPRIWTRLVDDRWHFHVCLWASAAVMVGLTLVLLTNFGGDFTSQAIDDGVTFAAAAAASVGCLIAARSGGPARRFWLLLGVACFFWACGEAFWGLYEVVLAVEVPSPSIADLFYLAAVPLAAAAVICHPALSNANSRRMRFVLDGFIAADSILFLAWALVLEPLISAEGSIVERVVTLAYPLGDAVIVALILLALGRAQDFGRLPLYWVLAGLLALALADSGYAYLTEVRGYETGSLIDLGWVAGYLLLMLGALRSTGNPIVAVQEPAPPTTIRTVAPYLPVFLGLIIATHHLVLTRPERDPVLWVSGLTTIALVVVRQFIAMADNAELARDLDAKVRERTKELADREALLERQVEELQELDRIKGDFVSTASHELRTPLTSILGQLEVLRDGEFGALTNEEKRSLAIMDRNCHRLLSLIEDLLTLSRIESTGVQLRPFEADVLHLLYEVEDSIRPLAAARPVDLQFEIGEDLGSLSVDSSQLERALLNLLSNAIKFTPPGGSVTLTADRTYDSLVISVTDTGIGIPLAEQERLFTRFFRSSLATEKAIQGSGLGLVISKNIVEAHGGTLSLSSVEGEGTVVTVTLPAPPIGLDAPISRVAA